MYENAQGERDAAEYCEKGGHLRAPVREERGDHVREPEEGVRNVDQERQGGHHEDQVGCVHFPSGPRARAGARPLGPFAARDHFLPIVQDARDARREHRVQHDYHNLSEVNFQHILLCAV